jgi:signal transduction histidine kinase
MEAGWSDRLRRVDPRIWDALLAVVLLGLFVFELALSDAVTRDATGTIALGYALAVVVAAPLWWRRRAPLTVLVVVALGDAALSLLGYESASGLALMVALYTASSLRERGPLALVIAPLFALSGTALLLDARNWVEVLATVVVEGGIPIAFGRVVFNRRRRVVRDREEAAREAVSVERSRIARELHDIVAHHMSVMVVQAAAARAVAGRDPAAADDALRQIETSGRAGLTEMRRLLEILKSQERGEERAPQPGLARLDELVDGMRATGLSVETVVEGTPHELPPGVDLSAYRIVQEALTNTLKHAGDAHARVLLRYEPGAIEIEVADDGRGAGNGETAGGGQGLIGMRERVQLFGGTLDSGPRDGGGFVVRARLPALDEATT